MPNNKIEFHYTINRGDEELVLAKITRILRQLHKLKDNQENDFEFETAIAHTNRDLAPIETVFLLTAASTSYISSSIVRDVIRNDGDYTKLVPNSVRIK